MKPALKKNDRLYFIGIGGTGMASVAGLCLENGFQVFGSDAGVYPPMSTMLKHLKIPYETPYDPRNLEAHPADAYVVANVLSPGHVELEAALASGKPTYSFPEILNTTILSKRTSVVIAGTHGKTTTTSLLASILSQLGYEPGYMIGGIPRGFEKSFALGKGPLFVIEGDEYDTAYFDKGPKFLHYAPQYLILNNIEFDHADIYKDLASIKAAFSKLIDLVPNPRHILANVDDPEVKSLLLEKNMLSKVTSVSTKGLTPEATVVLSKGSFLRNEGPQQIWQGHVKGPTFTLPFETSLSGAHNLANITQCVAALWLICQNEPHMTFKQEALRESIRRFEAPQRRLEFLGTWKNLAVYEDFAHHPTAVEAVIQGFQEAHPETELWIAFEPRSATNRRNVFEKRYAEVFKKVQRVLLGECSVDKRIPEGQRFNSKRLAESIGPHALAFEQNTELLAYIKNQSFQNHSIIFMSSGSFSGIQYELTQK